MDLPIADTTTTTSSPARRVRATWSATARMRSGSATEVPPNFWTRSTAIKATGGPACPLEGFPRYILRLCPAPTSEPARRRTRERRASSARPRVKRRKRDRSTITFGIVGVVFVGVIVLLSVGGGGKKKAGTTTTTTTPRAAASPTVPPKASPKTYKPRRR